PFAPEEWPLARSLDTGEDVRDLLVRLERDQGPRYLCLSSSPVRDAGGQLVAALLLAIDVTESVGQEEALRRGEERFRAIATSKRQVIWSIDNQGRPVLTRDNWLDFTGQTDDEASGAGWLEAVHPDDRVDAAARWLAVREEKRPLEVEGRLRRPGGG